jgi:hypothetical protein
MAPPPGFIGVAQGGLADPPPEVDTSACDAWYLAHPGEPYPPECAEYLTDVHGEDFGDWDHISVGWAGGGGMMYSPAPGQPVVPGPFPFYQNHHLRDCFGSPPPSTIAPTCES